MHRGWTSWRRPSPGTQSAEGWEQEAEEGRGQPTGESVDRACGLCSSSSQLGSGPLGIPALLCPPDSLSQFPTHTRTLSKALPGALSVSSPPGPRPEAPSTLLGHGLLGGALPALTSGQVCLTQAPQCAWVLPRAQLPSKCASCAPLTPGHPEARRLGVLGPQLFGT